MKREYSHLREYGIEKGNAKKIVRLRREWNQLVDSGGFKNKRTKQRLEVIESELDILKQPILARAEAVICEECNSIVNVTVDPNITKSCKAHVSSCKAHEGMEILICSGTTNKMI